MIEEAKLVALHPAIESGRCLDPVDRPRGLIVLIILHDSECQGQLNRVVVMRVLELLEMFGYNVSISRVFYCTLPIMKMID